MSGRYIVIEVDDISSASMLIERLKNATKLRVVGLFFKPTQYCGCGGYSDHEQLTKVKRHKRFGVYICRQCGLTRPGPQNPKNLLAENGPYLHPILEHHSLMEAH